MSLLVCLRTPVLTGYPYQQSSCSVNRIETGLWGEGPARVVYALQINPGWRKVGDTPATLTSMRNLDLTFKDDIVQATPSTVLA